MLPDTVVGRTIAASVAGGAASALGGGKFANGAVSAAFVHLFNSEAETIAEAIEKEHGPWFRFSIGFSGKSGKFKHMEVNVNEELDASVNLKVHEDSSFGVELSRDGINPTPNFDDRYLPLPVPKYSPIGIEMNGDRAFYELQRMDITGAHRRTNYVCGWLAQNGNGMTCD